MAPGFRGTNTLKVSFDKSGNASFQSEGHVVSTLTNVANGKVVHVDGAGRDAFSDAGVVHPDGTITSPAPSRGGTCGSTPLTGTCS